MNISGFLRLVVAGIILVGFFTVIVRAIIKRVTKITDPLRASCIIAVLLAYGLFCLFMESISLAIPGSLAFAIAGFCSVVSNARCQKDNSERSFS